ncbi:MAG: hypothetical protein ACE1ZA_18075 [Pseudomonadales bacterium]
MKRWIAKLVVFVIFGAVVNVAVAWGCGLRDYRNYFEGRLATEDDTRWWDAHVPEDFPVSPGEVGDNLAFGVSATIMEEQWVSQTKFPSWVIRTRAGLPVRALEGSMWVDFSRRGRRVIERHLKKVFDKRPPVPVRPIWPGFAINTIFFAAILWLPLAPFQFRRYVRVKHGHCIKCGYDLRGAEHEVCPECGHELFVRTES